MTFIGNALQKVDSFLTTTVNDNAVALAQTTVKAARPYIKATVSKATHVAEKLGAKAEKIIVAYPLTGYTGVGALALTGYHYLSKIQSPYWMNPYTSDGKTARPEFKAAKSIKFLGYELRNKTLGIRLTTSTFDYTNLGITNRLASYARRFIARPLVVAAAPVLTYAASAIALKLLRLNNGIAALAITLSVMAIEHFKGVDTLYAKVVQPLFERVKAGFNFVTDIPNKISNFWINRKIHQAENKVAKLEATIKELTKDQATNQLYEELNGLEQIKLENKEIDQKLSNELKNKGIKFDDIKSLLLLTDNVIEEIKENFVDIVDGARYIELRIKHARLESAEARILDQLSKARSDLAHAKEALGKLKASKDAR